MLLDPAAQQIRVQAELFGDLFLRATLADDLAHRLQLEFLREATPCSLLPYAAPPAGIIPG
jgi:hypothetical protein